MVNPRKLATQVVSHRIKVTSLVVGALLLAVGHPLTSLLTVTGAVLFALGAGQLAAYWGTHDV